MRTRGESQDKSCFTDCDFTDCEALTDGEINHLLEGNKRYLNTLHRPRSITQQESGKKKELSIDLEVAEKRVQPFILKIADVKSFDELLACWESIKRECDSLNREKDDFVAVEN